MGVKTPLIHLFFHSSQCSVMHFRTSKLWESCQSSNIIGRSGFRFRNVDEGKRSSENISTDQHNCSHVFRKVSLPSVSHLLYPQSPELLDTKKIRILVKGDYPKWQKEDSTWLPILMNLTILEASFSFHFL